MGFTGELRIKHLDISDVGEIQYKYIKYLREEQPSRFDIDNLLNSSYTDFEMLFNKVIKYNSRLNMRLSKIKEGYSIKFCDNMFIGGIDLHDEQWLFELFAPYAEDCVLYATRVNTYIRWPCVEGGPGVIRIKNGKMHIFDSIEIFNDEFGVYMQKSSFVDALLEMNNSLEIKAAIEKNKVADINTWFVGDQHQLPNFLIRKLNNAEAEEIITKFVEGMYEKELWVEKFYAFINDVKLDVGGKFVITKLLTHQLPGHISVVVDEHNEDAEFYRVSFYSKELRARIYTPKTHAVFELLSPYIKDTEFELTADSESTHELPAKVSIRNRNVDICYTTTNIPEDTLSQLKIRNEFVDKLSETTKDSKVLLLLSNYSLGPLAGLSELESLAKLAEILSTGND